MLFRPHIAMFDSFFLLGPKQLLRQSFLPYGTLWFQTFYYSGSNDFKMDLTLRLQHGVTRSMHGHEFNLIF